MDIKTAIEILEHHQEWRIGKRDDMVCDSKTLTKALDLILSEVKLNVSQEVKPEGWKTAEEMLRNKFKNSFLDLEYVDLYVEAMEEYASQTPPLSSVCDHYFARKENGELMPCEFCNATKVQETINGEQKTIEVLEKALTEIAEVSDIDVPANSIIFKVWMIANTALSEHQEVTEQKTAEEIFNSFFEFDEQDNFVVYTKGDNLKQAMLLAINQALLSPSHGISDEDIMEAIEKSGWLELEDKGENTFEDKNNFMEINKRVLFEALRSKLKGVNNG